MNIRFGVFSIILILLFSCSNNDSNRLLNKVEIQTNNSDTTSITVYFDCHRIDKVFTYLNESERLFIQKYDSISQIILEEFVIDVNNRDTLNYYLNQLIKDTLYENQNESNYSIIGFNKEGLVDTISTYYQNTITGYEIRVYDKSTRLVKIEYFNIGNKITQSYSLHYKYIGNNCLPMEEVFINFESKDTITTFNTFNSSGLVKKSETQINKESFSTNVHYWINELPRKIRGICLPCP